ncbi:hypothetical protein [uncultured Marinobacter sp.]|uniref:hypothetical protein n=1 Tax=uncultured Marinobacter sp. TaxID=187379 RepID=UPI00258E9A20|nr:hypothetical protein [uncultured Marinobacter sp.]
MDDIDSDVKRVHEYAVENEISAFDKSLPGEPGKLPVRPKRISYQTVSGSTKIIALKKKNKYHQIIFNACVAGYKSDWFAGISDRSKPAYFDRVRKYFDWINESGYATTGKNRYESLKAYEAYCLNDRELKSSSLVWINAVIREGLGCPSISDSDQDFLQTLLSLSKPAKKSEPDPVTLSRWFDLPWLREIIGEQAYLQLESPRLVLKSFRVTIATTLIYLLEKRRHWQMSSVIKVDESRESWQLDWNRALLERYGKFNERFDPEDEFTHLLWLDLVTQTGQVALKELVTKTGSRNLSRRVRYQNKSIIPWQKPAFFHPDNQMRYSHIEELLCAWLAACEAIQPADIPKLKTSNYTRERNASGRLIAMECTYYKGRSGSFKQPATLMGGTPWAEAMDRYMAGLSEPSLFKTSVGRQDGLSIPRLHQSLNSRHNAINLLIKIWKLPSFQRKLESELKRHEATPLFLHAMLALVQGGESYFTFYSRTGKMLDEYRELTARPLPTHVFSLTHIKNTAVHAGTDAYREADLINYHSHTSLTEKTSYLTDKNKEWVNQAGRITRLVLHDLQNVVFQPSIAAIDQSVHDLELRTRVNAATHTNDIVTHSLQTSTIERESDGTILVSDTSDTALYFIHYITQAEQWLPRLLAVRPDWVERELIVKVEWMTRTLSRMRSAATAQKAYKNLAIHLPPLFAHLLETTE